MTTNLGPTLKVHAPTDFVRLNLFDNQLIFCGVPFRQPRLQPNLNSEKVHLERINSE
jgi:hypothetical protein